MRLSVRESDPGYCAEAFFATVSLDGKPVSHCFTADEETGEVFCYAQGESGQPLIDGDHVVEVVLRGHVQITIGKDWTAGRQEEARPH